MDREEGEMSDDAMIVDGDEPSEAKVEEMQHIMTFKADKSGIVVNMEKIDASKLDERAKRFGLNLSGNRVITQQHIDELYANCGVESGNERHFRFDALHLNGIDGLTTREIFEYLEDFKPVSLEKIDNVSCNIVCQDHISAALALLVHSREIKNEDVKEMLAAKSQYHWREGMPHPKKDLILMRFATNGDKKIAKRKPEVKTSEEFYDENTDSASKNPWGDLCKSWGVYDHQEIFQRKLPKETSDDEIDEPNPIVQIRNKRLALRLGKRTHKVEESDNSSSDSEWKKKSKTPRMRMHADDEESKIRKKLVECDNDSSSEKDMYAPLSIEVVNFKSQYSPRESTRLSDKFKTHSKPVIQKSNVQSRLGAKIVPTENVSCDGSSSDESIDHNVLSRVQKVSTKASNSSNVWSRLETKDKDSNSGVQSDLRHILKSKRQNKSDDLRDKISKSKQTNLRIEIDNNYARN